MSERVSRHSISPAKWIKPQLTRLVDEAPTGASWLHEIKNDGYRMHARIDGGKVALLTRCACRKLHPAILMVKPAQDGQSSELAEPLRLSTARRILPQGQVRSQFVVVAGIADKDPAQMGLAEDDDVIEAFPADRADQSLRMPVLPG
jgi:hypothetical protein